MNLVAAITQLSVENGQYPRTLSLRSWLHEIRTGATDFRRLPFYVSAYRDKELEQAAKRMDFSQQLNRPPTQFPNTSDLPQIWNWLRNGDGRHVAGANRKVAAYELYQRKYETTRSYFECQIISVRLREETSELYTTSSDGCARVWDYKTGKLKKVLMHTDYQDDIISIDYCTASGNIITASHDTARIRVWSDQYKLLKSIRLKEKPIRQVRFTADPQIVVVQAGDTIISALNLKSGELKRLSKGTLEDHSNVTNRSIQRRFFGMTEDRNQAMIYNPSSDRLETFGLDDTSAFSTSTKSVGGQIFDQPLDPPVPSMISVSDRCDIALLEYFGELFLFYGENFGEARPIRSDVRAISDFALSSRGDYAITAHVDGTLSQWDTFRGASTLAKERFGSSHRLSELCSSGPGSKLAFAICDDNGERLLVCYSRGTIRPVANLGRFGRDWTDTIAIDCFDERAFLAASENWTTFNLLEVQFSASTTASSIKPFRSVVSNIFTNPLSKFCLSNNNRLLAASDDDCIISVFDLKNGNCLLTIPKTVGTIAALVWVDDLNAIAAGLLYNNHVQLIFLKDGFPALNLKTSDAGLSDSVEGLLNLDKKNLLLGWGSADRSKNGAIWVWNLDTPGDQSLFQLFPNREISRLSASNCQSILFILFSDGELTVLKAKDLSKVGGVNLHYRARGLLAGQVRNRVFILNDAVGIGECEIDQRIFENPISVPSILWSHTKRDWVGPIVRCNTCGTYSKQVRLESGREDQEFECVGCGSKFRLSPNIFDGASQFEAVMKLATLKTCTK